MAESIYKKEHREELKKKVLTLYKQGLSTRAIGKIVEKSHSWVAYVLKELEAVSTV